MKHARWLIPSGIAALALLLLLLQQGRLGDLEETVQELRASLDELAEQPPPPTKVPAPVGTATVRAYDDTQLRKRVAALERKARARVAAASGTTRPWAPDADPEEETEEEVAALREDVDALLTGAGVESPEARKKIRQLVDAARQEARAERHQRRAERQAQADTEWLEQFTKEAGLDQQQADGLGKIMAERREAQSATWQALREGEKTWQEARQERRALRQQNEQKIENLLTPEQFAKYQESRPRGGRGGPRFRGGRGDR